MIKDLTCRIQTCVSDVNEIHFCLVFVTSFPILTESPWYYVLDLIFMSAKLNVSHLEAIMSTFVNSDRKHPYKCSSNARKPKVRQNLQNDSKVVCLDPLWHFQDTRFSTIKTPASKGLKFKTVLVFDLKVH